MDLSSKSIHIFNEKYGIKNENGIKLDFKKHSFLWDIYSDFTPKQVCLKAAQIGFSTLAIIKTLYVSNYRNFDIIYTLPTAGDVYDFVTSKVNRIIQQNPILQEWVKDRDTIEQKKVNKNVIYYRGTFVERAALMVSSDLNVHDEIDRSDQSVVGQYASRLQHSNNKWEWKFSNPSVKGNGVDRDWTISDQKHWFIKCSHCSKEQYINWPDNIDLERKIFICKHCKKELSSEDRRVGRWVPKYRNREVSGYWISLLMAPWITAKEICDYFDTKSKEYFWNFVLGLPYIGEGNTITPDIIYRNLTDLVNNQERCVIGVDSGVVKHFVVGNKQGLFYYGKTENWDDIEQLLRRFQKSIMVIDAMPDITKPRELREKYPGRVFLCHYAKDRKTMQLIRWGEHNEFGNVLADRNRVLQMVLDEFADMRIPLQGNKEDWSEYYSHWDTMYKMVEKDALGVEQFSWETSTGKDHFCHATAYWRIGMDRHVHESSQFINTSPIKLPYQMGVEIGIDNTINFKDLL